ncbi:TadE/TadG family type IV pilus assembly protein [Tabrizicola sp.]|uniref:TadE/TadG family type IV pilus assembly protein n=1 Tax=Tabrizicola sp. TaxID=2005166 RepID=UPI003F2ABE3F
MTMRKLKHHFRSFVRDEDGLILVEALMMLPLLIWVLIAMFIYWDVFRTINVTQKAAYSIADLLSRQEVAIPISYANGLQNVVDFLTPGGHPVKLRITSFKYDEGNVNDAGDDKYELLFSYSPNCKMEVWEEGDIQSWKTRTPGIPELNGEESVFVVETEVEFKTQMRSAVAGLMINVDNATFTQFIVTRPRKGPLQLDGVSACPT